MSADKKVFVGAIVSSSSLKVLSFAGFLSAERGKITKIGLKEEFNTLFESGAFADHEIVALKPDQLLIPGFVDCHTHAPQFPNIGVGLDRPLLQWLDKYTFPLERRYKDTEFAAKVYDTVVQRLLTNGTTTACYFGSLHFDSTVELARSAIKHRQRALVGKVSMNLKNESGYYNDTDTELAEVEDFIQQVFDFKNDLVQPIVTPRSALCCDKELMRGLANISKKYDCGIQSHISENLKGIENVLQKNPSCHNYGDVYDKCAILNDKCILAHAIHLSSEEIALLGARGVSIAHCPASNTRLRSGLCPVRNYLDHHLCVGLGTDVSGGDSASIMDAMRRTMDVSTHLDLFNGGNGAISWTEAFYLATMGGAKALNLEDKVGNFEVGKELDALLVDVFAAGGAVDRCDERSGEMSDERSGEASHERGAGLLQRFIYLGDDRNIVRVYVKGDAVKDIS